MRDKKREKRQKNTRKSTIKAASKRKENEETRQENRRRIKAYGSGDNGRKEETLEQTKIYTRGDGYSWEKKNLKQKTNKG